ncbi:hypothetical protein IV203_004550 [Nitzschia inconspicua]|uniref:Uncharacterized protein n=1 Tax=Nitzschia inconspicua TaxID=303405 RepID=A0A9K3L4L0_9STRA|nr:hypothetical protein IV203_004550 [Nitzschia inconspicua]
MMHLNNPSIPRRRSLVRLSCTFLQLLSVVTAFQTSSQQPQWSSASSTNPNRYQRNHDNVSILKSTSFPILESDHVTTNRDIEYELLIGRPFQLEEKEDSANCITEIVLQSDHTIYVGQSDGPLFQKAVGSWSYDQEAFPSDVAFAMKLYRTYKAGYKGSDMGEFSFVVSRIFVGYLTQVGHAIAIEGSIYNDDDEEDATILGARDGRMARVGFFSMIDTTPSKEDQENGEIDNNQRPNFMMRTSTSF